MAQVLALGFNWRVAKPCYRRKTLLVIGGTRTQVFADNMAIAASALNYCATKGLATRSDENEQKSFTGQHETISFITRPATRKRMSSMLVFHFGARATVSVFVRFQSAFLFACATTNRAI